MMVIIIIIIIIVVVVVMVTRWRLVANGKMVGDDGKCQRDKLTLCFLGWRGRVTRASCGMIVTRLPGGEAAALHYNQFFKVLLVAKQTHDT